MRLLVLTVNDAANTCFGRKFARTKVEAALAVEIFYPKEASSIGTVKERLKDKIVIHPT